ncbi:hypothetical protein VCRA2116O425_370023 [Vibrio crassostreae]|nr:hypothetical protein VCRA2116O425_370023 [Vibrio crassostreae]CAK3363586.1 hypothetical protein VCRA2123O445_360023 [Vibrio crassostreae]CAK3883753.1 hypothetical protein VCRA2120O434_340011 [Vibrio crassostreae]
MASSPKCRDRPRLSGKRYIYKPRDGRIKVALQNINIVESKVRESLSYANISDRSIRLCWPRAY